jgi:hypothetical protein
MCLMSYHIEKLSNEIHCQIKLKDANRTLVTCSYSCPRKYQDAWKMLIQHLDSGWICPSSSSFISLAFIIPKKDSTVLPQWVK